MRLALSAVFALLVFPLAAPAQEPDGGPPISITGELDIVVEDDFARGRSRTAHAIRDSVTGELFDLEFERQPTAALKTGDSVTISGHAYGRRIRVTDMTLGPGGDAFQGGAGPAEESASAPASETRRIVVLLVDFDTDGDGNADIFASPHDPIQVNDSVFDGIPYDVDRDGLTDEYRSVRDLFAISSLGTLLFEGDVFGPFVISESTVGCKYYDWAYAAEDAATAAGVALSDYQHRLFVLPYYGDLQACPWAGVANVGCGSLCRAWTAEGESPMVTAHELGHNLDFAHAGDDPENDGVINDRYGDLSDPMGLSRMWHLFNAPHVDQKGWLPTTDVLSSGVFEIYALESPPSAGPQILKIAKPDSGDFYYLSYRQRIGYDDILQFKYFDRINIHRYRGQGYAFTSFIDSLGNHETFVDSVNGLTITQLRHRSEFATVEVAFGCATAAPTVGVSPSSQAGSPGDQLNYTVTVTNNDADQCGSTAFDLIDGYTGPLSGTLAPNTMTLSPNGFDTATLVVDTVSAVDGTYSVEIEVSDDGGHAGQAGYGTATVIVDDTAPAPPSNLSASVKRKTQVQLTWDAASDGNGSGIAGYLIYRDDGAEYGPTTNTSYLDSNTASGATYTYWVEAFDGSGLMSGPSNSATLTVGGSSGGGTDDGGTKPGKGQGRGKNK